MNDELTKKKISEKNKTRRKYLEKLELLKQSYGVEFKIDSFKNNDINKIKFYNLNYKKSIKDVTIIYDNKYGKFNYLSYNLGSEKNNRDLSNYKIISDLDKEMKLSILVDEILRLNNEYKRDLIEVDAKYSNFNEMYEEKAKELEIDKKVKKE